MDPMTVLGIVVVIALLFWIITEKPTPAQWISVGVALALLFWGTPYIIRFFQSL